MKEVNIAINTTTINLNVNIYTIKNIYMLIFILFYFYFIYGCKGDNTIAPYVYMPENNKKPKTDKIAVKIIGKDEKYCLDAFCIPIGQYENPEGYIYCTDNHTLHLIDKNIKNREILDSILFSIISLPGKSGSEVDEFLLKAYDYKIERHLNRAVRHDDLFWISGISDHHVNWFGFSIDANNNNIKLIQNKYQESLKKYKLQMLGYRGSCQYSSRGNINFTALVHKATRTILIPGKYSNRALYAYTKKCSRHSAQLNKFCNVAKILSECGMDTNIEIFDNINKNAAHEIMHFTSTSLQKRDEVSSEYYSTLAEIVSSYCPKLAIIDLISNLLFPVQDNHDTPHPYALKIFLSQLSSELRGKYIIDNQDSLLEFVRYFIDIPFKGIINEAYSKIVFENTGCTMENITECTISAKSYESLLSKRKEIGIE